MQLGLDFGGGGLFDAIRDQLREAFGPYEPTSPRTPAGQLVKSMISSRTLDAVSLGAYDRLIGRFPSWQDLAAAAAEDVEAMISDVRWPEPKAPQVIAALRLVSASHPDYDLRFWDGDR